MKLHILNLGRSSKIEFKDIKYCNKIFFVMFLKDLLTIHKSKILRPITHLTDLDL